MAENKTMQINLKATWKDETKSGLQGLKDNVKKAALAVGALGGVVGAFSLNEARKFETSLSNMSTLISGDSTAAINDLKNGILEISKAVPKSAQELGVASYDILSAGISDSADAMFVLKQSANLAVGGLGSTTEAVDLMTSSLNAFGIDADRSDLVADILFKTVKNGKTTVSELAQSFGQVAPVMAAAGLTLEELSAATAALTTSGLSASVAQNQLRAATLAIQAPTKDMSDLLKKLGYDSGQAALDQLGLVGTFEALNKEANGNAETLKKAFGSVEALGAATALAGEQNEIFKNTLADMSSGTNALDEAVKKQSETFASQWQLLQNKIFPVFLKIGNLIMSAAIPAMNFLSDAFDDAMKIYKDHEKTIKNVLAKAFDILEGAVKKVVDIVEEVIEFFKENEGVTKTLAVIIGSLAVAYGIVTTAIGIYNVIMGIATGITTAFGAVIAFITSPIGIAVAAIAAMIAIGVLLWQNWDVIKEKIKEIWSSITGWISEKVGVVGETLGRWVEGAKEKAGQFKDALVGAVTGAFDKVKEIIGNIKQWISDKVSGMVDAILGFLGNIKQVGATISEAIKDFINRNVIDKINGIEFTVLGKTIGLPDIPRLAKGGDFVTNGPQMVMVGDNPGGRERVQVTPLSSPNINGPKGGNTTVNNTFNIQSNNPQEVLQLVKQYFRMMQTENNLGINNGQ